jgi:hypothetical protein
MNRNKERECRSARVDPYIEGLSLRRLHVETRHRLPGFQCMAGKRKTRAYRAGKQTLPAVSACLDEM